MSLTPVHSYQRRVLDDPQDIAFSPTICAPGEHEQRTKSVTALQDWLSIRPTMDTKGLKALICEALGLSTDEPVQVDDPPLMGRGVERC
jgi:hypothetical protein